LDEVENLREVEVAHVVTSKFCRMKTLEWVKSFDGLRFVGRGGNHKRGGRSPVAERGDLGEGKGQESNGSGAR